MREYSIVPSLSYNVDPRCNMRCVYCPIHYENYQPSESIMDPDLALDVFRATLLLNFYTFRLSGGEPLLRAEHVAELIAELQRPSGESPLNIRLNTNGLLLEKHLPVLKEAGYSTLKVSIDTLDKDKFVQMTGTDTLDKVKRGVEKAVSMGMHVELNMVYTKTNANDVWDLLSYCQEVGIPVLKVLDLVEYDDPAYWHEHYVSPQSLIDALREKYGDPSILSLSSKRGVRMLEFKIDASTRVLIKDCRQGTTYSRTFCAECPHFPCQEGFYNLTLNSDGKLKPCRLRADYYVDLVKEFEAQSGTSRIEGIQRLISEWLGSAYSDMFEYDGWKDTALTVEDIPVPLKDRVKGHVSINSIQVR